MLIIVTGIVTIIPHALADVMSTEVSIAHNASSKECQISKTCYYPYETQIDPGDTVTWINDDDASHTVTSVDAGGSPDGKFDSSMMAAGQTFSFTFKDAGAYKYFCQVHSWMTGVVTVQGFSVSDGQTSSNGKILVSITKNQIVYLSSQDRLVRAHVEILDYSPVDGDLLMKIVKKSSGKILSESNIYVRQNSGNIWSTEIGYLLYGQNLNDTASLIGSYEIQVGPENGAYEGSATFSVLPAPIPAHQIQSITAADPETEKQSQSSFNQSKIPLWIKNIFKWYSEGSISDDEMLTAIKFLVDRGIIKL